MNEKINNQVEASETSEVSFFVPVLRENAYKFLFMESYVATTRSLC